MTSCLGIDLGTTRCKAARLGADSKPEDIPNENGQTTTPSAFLFTKGEVLFGQEAENATLLEPEGYVSGWKRMLEDENWKFVTPDGAEHSARALTAMALRHLIADAERFTGEKVTHVVLSVPANFNDGQRRMMKNIASDVGVDLLGIINEPTSACMAYALDKKPGKPVLVYDLGGGTFDVTLLQFQGDHVEVLASDGIPKCGGTDLLAALESHCLDLFEQEHDFRPNPEEHAFFCQELRLACERAKLSLSARKKTVVTANLDGKPLLAKITRDTFEDLIRGIVEPTIDTCAKVLEQAELKPKEVDVVLVGGASRTPLVSVLLKKAFGKEPKKNVDPDHAVSRGAAIEAALRLRDQGVTATVEGVAILPPPITMTDVSPYPLGCLAIGRDTGDKRCVVIVGKNEPLPAEHFDMFDLEREGQEQAHVVVVQGDEGATPDDCHEIGDVTLDLDPAGPTARRVRVAYRYDSDGVVHVEATDTHSGQQAAIQLATSHGDVDSSDAGGEPDEA